MASPPLAVVMPVAMASMEAASNDLWLALRRLSVTQLKALKPTYEYVPLIEALIAVRDLMDMSIDSKEFVPKR